MVRYILDIQLTYGSALCSTTVASLPIRKDVAHLSLFITKHVYQSRKLGRENYI